MNRILETKNLTKEFKKQVVLQNVSIKVERGKIYGLLGPNGAGKSTLLKIITNVIHKTSGEILFEGKSMSTDDLKKIGAMIEQPAIYPNLTAYENLDVMATLLGIEKSRIEKMLSIVSLEEVNKKLVKNFSLGMKQRLGIVMALMNHPSLLILDEPTNGLDPLGIQELRDFMKSLSKQGITIIVSSHILSEMQLLADRIGIINKGKLIYEGEKSSKQMDLEKLFVQMIRKDGKNK